MRKLRNRLTPVVGALLLLAAAVPSVASDSVKPKTGRYTAKCPQGYGSACGEASWNVVSHDGKKKIAKPANVPWPNDPASPGVGVCGRYNPTVQKSIPIKDGKFSYTGKSDGHSFTWKGHWVKPGKVKGTVKWDGCSTEAKYTGHHD
jgi:hypothetical protein